MPRNATSPETPIPHPTGPRVRPVPAVSRTIAILRLLGDAKQPMGVKAIADALEIIPSTCLHILRVLVSEELVVAEPSTKKYALGSGMIRLARSVLEGGGFTQLTQPALDRLASASGATAMGVEISPRQGCVVLAISRSHHHFRLHTDVGSQFSTLVSATGRLIAAHSGETTAQLRKKFANIQWDQPPTFEAWKEEVTHARTEGWSMDRDHFLAGVTVLAVPVFAATGRMSHTLVLVGLSSQMNDATAQKLAKQMQDEATRIGAALLQN